MNRIGLEDNNKNREDNVGEAMRTMLARLRLQGREIRMSREEEIKRVKGGLSKDYISRQSIKQKLQRRRDFIINAYGCGCFDNLAPNYKERVCELTNCITVIGSEPSVHPNCETKMKEDKE